MRSSPAWPNPLLKSTVSCSRGARPSVGRHSSTFLTGKPVRSRQEIVRNVDLGPRHFLYSDRDKRILDTCTKIQILGGKNRNFWREGPESCASNLENGILVHVCQVAVCFGVLYRCLVAHHYRRAHRLFPSTDPQIFRSWFTDALFSHAPLFPGGEMTALQPFKRCRRFRRL